MTTAKKTRKAAAPKTRNAKPVKPARAPKPKAAPRAKQPKAKPALRKDEALLLEFAARVRRRNPTKADRLIEMLRRKNGATMGELIEAFGIQRHTVRAMLSVHPRKRGLTVERDGKGLTARYRIVA